MHVLLLVACSTGLDFKTGEADDESAFAAEEWPSTDDNEGEGAEHSIRDDATFNERDGECPLPSECVQLAEGVDRGDVSIKMTGMGAINIMNRAEYSVCLDGWYAFTGGGTQDAIGGVSDHTELAPGESTSLWYGRWQNDPKTWWCIEEDQYTATNATYDFNGSDAPDLAVSYALDEHDEDADGIEDHEEGDDHGLQSQHDIWNYLDESPVIVVGRETNYLQLAKGDAVGVRIEVRNLGRKAGVARVTETVEAGNAAAGWSLTPSSSTTDTNTGSVTYVFDVAVPAAQDPENGGTATYGAADIHYQLQYGGACGGREIGSPPRAYWEDASGDTYLSAGADLVIECCAEQAQAPGD